MKTAPPKIHPSPSTGWFVGMVLAAVGLGAAAVVYCFDPSTHRFYPGCQFHRLTGLNCPGCGMTRALAALVHGHVSAALHDNALFVGVLCLLLLRGGWWAVKQFRGQAAGEFLPVKFLWPVLIAALVFAVARNLPAGAFLSP